MICSKFANEQGWTYFKDCILARHYSCRHLKNKICQTSRPLSPSRLPLRAHFHQKRDVWVRGRRRSVMNYKTYVFLALPGTAESSKRDLTAESSKRELTPKSKEAPQPRKKQISLLKTPSKEEGKMSLPAYYNLIVWLSLSVVIQAHRKGIVSVCNPLKL